MPEVAVARFWQGFYASYQQVDKFDFVKNIALPSSPLGRKRDGTPLFRDNVQKNNGRTHKSSLKCIGASTSTPPASTGVFHASANGLITME